MKLFAFAVLSGLVWLSAPAEGQEVRLEQVSTLTHTNESAHYRDLLVAAFITEQERKTCNELDENGRFDVFHCTSWTHTWLSKEDDRGLESIAVSVAALESALQSFGYRREVYELPLLKYERRRIQQKEGEFGGRDTAAEQLARRLEANRRRLQTDKPAFVYHQVYYSLASPSKYLIQPNPAPARMWRISQFRFNLCRVNYSNPWDVERCQWWRELYADQPVALGGTYRIQARWPNGDLFQRERTFEDYSMNPEPILIAITPQ